MSFSFGFAGDDIADDAAAPAQAPAPAPESFPSSNGSSNSNSAFPVPGQPQLPPTLHDLATLLSRLPSKIAYGELRVPLGKPVTPGADAGAGAGAQQEDVRIARRELWDVRVQLMAEDEAPGDDAAGAADGLGAHDVKTGVYEGGFKSWESSADLIQELSALEVVEALKAPLRVMELGCGTALPSLVLFQRAMAQARCYGPDRRPPPISLILADYNPSVLQLVTLPNLLLAWALDNRLDPALEGAFSIEDEVELDPAVFDAFRNHLAQANISLSFVSGAWSAEFVDLLYSIPAPGGEPARTILLGAETIYSPFALQAFTETMFAVLNREKEALAYVAAKRMYFGVGGSLDDFVDKARARGADVQLLREETEGVRRGVVRCVLGTS